MVDVFISYANEDRESAAQVARLLESVGWSVWWDRRIPAGRTWRSVLEDALGEMRCMIALWSKHSVGSPWVTEEAEEARRLGKTLVPILIQRVEPPIGFRAIQAADLVDWDGSIDDPAVKLLIADLESLLGAPSAKRVPRSNPVAEPDDKIAPSFWHQLRAHWPKAALAGVAVVALLAGWQTWKNPEQTNPAPLPPAIDDNSKAIPAPRLVGLTVSGERREIKPSDTLKLRLMANYSDGRQNDSEASVQWVSSNSSVAIVNQEGEVKGLRAGSADIIAKSGAVVSSAWTLIVKADEPAVKPVAVAKLVALNIISNRNELLSNEKILVRAKGRYSDNSEKFLSDAVEWETSNRTIALISKKGELETLRPGRVEVLARSGHLQSNPLPIVVRETQAKPQPQAKSTGPSEPQTVVPPPSSEQLKARILPFINRAKSFREQGNYPAALAELDRAKAIDALNEEVRTEIEQTRRACNAEKVLGNKANC